MKKFENKYLDSFVIKQEFQVEVKYIRHLKHQFIIFTEQHI